MAFKLFGLFSTAGAPKAISATVPGGSTGALFTVSRLLGGSSTLALLSGSNSNLSLSGSAIAANAALVSASQTAVVREYDSATQRSVEYPVTLTGDGAQPPVAISGTPGAATQNSAYSFTPTVTGGSGTKTFSQTGTLPAGLSFSTSTGAITGTPTTAGTSSGLSITVTDDSGSATLSNLTITVTAVTWILANGSWDDNAPWDDTQTWKDAA